MAVNNIQNNLKTNLTTAASVVSNFQQPIDKVANLAKEIFPLFTQILTKPSADEQAATAVVNATNLYTARLEQIGLRNPMDYAADLIELQKTGFTHTTPVGLADNGRIVPAANKTAGLNTQLLIAMIQKTYGTEMAQRMTRRYQLDSNRPMTIGEFKRVLVGLAANVRVSDLDLLFKNAAKGLDDQVLVAELKKYNPDLVQRLKDGKEPTAVEYAFALEMLRLVRVDGNAVPVVQALFIDGEGADEVYGCKGTQYKYFVEWMDYKAALHAGTWDQLRTQLPDVPKSYELALSEFFGKSLAYDELRQGMVFTVPNKDPEASPKTYSLVDNLSPRGDAVHGFFFQEDHVPAGQVQNLHLAFRGTAFSSQMFEAEASLFRDGALHQIGKEQFDARETEIIHRLERYLENQPNDQVVLNISGHSLGGADSQRALVLVTEAVANSPAGSPLRKISKIECIAHNSPGLEKGLNERFLKALDKIEQNPELREHLKVDINYVMHWFKLDGDYAQDLVQQVGDGFVGANAKNSTVLQRSVYNVYNDHLDVNHVYTPKGVETALECHSQRVFNPLLYPKAPKIEYVSEKDQNARIDEILNRQLETHYQLEHPHRLVQWISNAKWPVEFFNGKLHKYALLMIQLANSFDNSLEHRYT